MSEREHILSAACWCRPYVESYGGGEHDACQEREATLVLALRAYQALEDHMDACGCEEDDWCEDRSDLYQAATALRVKALAEHAEKERER